MSTIEELLDEQLETEENPICVIDKVTRKITMHEECKFFGVENDKRVERIKFKCPKEVGDENIDLTKCEPFIAYENANGEPGLYEIEDLSTEGDFVYFSWLLDEGVTKYKGNVKFIFYACKFNGDNTDAVWNTIPAQGVVEEGLDAVDRIEERESDIIESMLRRIVVLESIATQKDIIELDTTLKQRGMAADAKAVGDALNKLESKIPTASGGMSVTAADLLVTILRNAEYSTDQSDNITALATALNATNPDVPDVPDEPIVVRYAITNTLTECTNSNVATSLTEGASYTAMLTASEGFVLDAVTVMMGGADVTADVYADGAITISSVTGDVVITAVAVVANVLPFENGKTYTSAEFDITEGYFVNADGSLNENESFAYVDVPCRGANRIVCNSSVYTANFGVTYLDADKNFVQNGFNTVVTAADGTKTYEAYAPRNVEYARIMARVGNMPSLTITPIQDPMWDGTYEAGKWYRMPYMDDRIHNSTGGIVEKEGSCATDLMSIYGVTSMEIRNGSQRSFVLFYDAGQSYISTTVVQGTPTFDVPEGAVWMRYTADIANLNFPIRVLEKLSITNNLTQCTSSNNATEIVSGNGYTAMLTASSGFVMDSVVVTMGGVDVTSAVYADGVITISAVTGDVIITAVAVEAPAVALPFENGRTYTSEELAWEGGYEYSGTNITTSTWGDMFYFPCEGANRIVCNAHVYKQQGPLMLNENKQVLRQVRWVNLSVDGVEERTTMVSRDAKYLCVEASNGEIDGVTITLHQDPLWTGVYEIGKWYRTDTWTDDHGYNDSTGAYRVQNGLCCTGILQIFGAKTIEINYPDRHYFYFYDADKNFLKYQGFSGDATSGTVVTVPENAAYMAISTDKSAMANFALRVVE